VKSRLIVRRGEKNWSGGPFLLRRARIPSNIADPIPNATRPKENKALQAKILSFLIYPT
jgi:hypothetical protein